MMLHCFNGIDQFGLEKIRHFSHVKYFTFHGKITARAAILPIHRHFPPRLMPGTGNYCYGCCLRMEEGSSYHVSVWAASDLRNSWRL